MIIIELRWKEARADALRAHGEGDAEMKRTEKRRINDEDPQDLTNLTLTYLQQSYSSMLHKPGVTRGDVKNHVTPRISDLLDIMNNSINKQKNYK